MPRQSTTDNPTADLAAALRASLKLAYDDLLRVREKIRRIKDDAGEAIDCADRGIEELRDAIDSVDRAADVLSELV